MADRADLPLESLVGRDREVDQLLALLAADRLVTVTGLGGTGKTRLAREVAERWREGGSRAVFVDLSPITDPALVESRVLDALAPDHPENVEEGAAIVSALGDQPLLLILDNFELLVPGAPRVAAWLREAPAACALVTSRVPLGIKSERRFPLDPLAVSEGTDREATLSSPAATLFLREARRLGGLPGDAQPDAAVVAELCRRLGGLPLALELAAARVPMLGLQATADRLAAALVPAGALGGVIEWTVSLLSPSDQARAAMLGVLPGPFEEDLLRTLWATSDPWPTLERLVEVSLVRPARDGGGRFEVLVPVREVLAANLDVTAGRDQALSRCDAFLSGLAADRGTVPGVAPAFRRVRLARDLLDVVLDWQQHRDPVVAADLVWSLDLTWSRAGLARQGAMWARRLLDVGALPERSVAALTTVSAWCLLETSGPAEAVPAARRAVELAADCGRPDIEASAWFGLAQALDLDRDVIGAGRAFERALVLARANHDDRLEIAVLGNIATHQGRIGDRVAARSGLMATAEAARRTGDAFAEGMALGNLALVDDDDAAAFDLARRAWDLLAPLGDSAYSAWAATGYARGAMRIGQPREAARIIGETLDLVAEHGGWAEQSNEVDVVAWLASTQGRSIEAARLLGAADRICRDAGQPAATEEDLVQDRIRATLRAQLGPATFDRLCAAGGDIPGPGFFSSLREYLTPAFEPVVDGRYGRLSPREQQVLGLVAQGATDGDIADQLGITRKTASVHVSNLKGKVGVETRIDLALEGRRLTGGMPGGTE